MYKSLAVITTHPIQYNAPLFKLLNERKLKIKVFYTWGEKVLQDKFDPGFGKSVKWDIPLLEGYEYEFVKNVSTNPGSHAKDGIDNPDLIEKIKQWKAEAVLFFGWNFKSHLSAMKYFKGKIPVLFRGDSTLLKTQPFFKNMLRKIYLTYIYKNIDYALYVGSANKAYYQYCNIKAKQLVFAPHAIDNKRFEDEKNIDEKFINHTKQQLNIKHSDVTFFYCGKFQEEKNLFVLVNAFNKLTSTNTHLILIGNGIYEDNLKQLAKQNKQIHFLPFQNQSLMPSVYRLGDVFCLPSKSETWGLGVNEAMACAKAVLVSNKCGCAQDLVQEKNNGFVFKYNDENDCLQKVQTLISEKKNLSKMGEQSKTIIAHWSYEKQAEAILQILSK